MCSARYCFTTRGVLYRISLWAKSPDAAASLRADVNDERPVRHHCPRLRSLVRGDGKDAPFFGQNGVRSRKLDCRRWRGSFPRTGKRWCRMSKRLAIIPFVAGMAVLLGGCGLVDRIERLSGEQTAVSSPTAPDGAQRRTKPATKPVKRNSTSPRRAETVDAAKSKQSSNEDDAREEETVQERSVPKLVGMDQSEVAKVLGPPMAETDRAPGKVWRYWNSKCMVDVSMYLDVHSRSYRVIAYEVTNHDYTTGGRSACLAEFPKHDDRPTVGDNI